MLKGPSSAAEVWVKARRAPFALHMLYLNQGVSTILVGKNSFEFKRTRCNRGMERRDFERDLIQC